MAGRYCLFGKSEKWLAGCAFFVGKVQMAGGQCIFGGKLVEGSAFCVENVNFYHERNMFVVFRGSSVILPKIFT